MDTLTLTSRIDALEPRRLFALVNGNGISSTVTGAADYQSVDATVPIPGGYVIAGTFGRDTAFGNGQPRVQPRGATDLFLSVVKGTSASLLTIGGGEDDDGEPRFRDDRADYSGVPERVDDADYFFPLSGRAARTDEYVTKIALGPDGRLYVAIAFRQPISLDTRDGDASTLSPTKQFDADPFDSAILRYRIDGANLKLDRTLQIGGPFNDIIHDFAFASDGDLIVAGSFERRADFQPGKGSTVLNPSGRGDAFVARYGSKNKLEWVRQFGGDSSEESELEAAYGVAVSGDDVYVGGAFAADAEFDRRRTLDEDGQDDDDADENVRIEAERSDGFTLKLDADDGALAWVVGQGGDDLDAVRDVAIAPDGGVYNFGFFQDEADLDARVDRERIFTAADQDDAVDGTGADTDLFFTRLDEDGDQVWVKPFGGEARELIGSLTSTASGELTIAGSFAGTIDVDPSKRVRRRTSTETDVEDRNGNREFAYAGFFATYSANGALRSSGQIDGQRGQDVIVIDAARAANGALLVGGRYRGGLETGATQLPTRITTQKRPNGYEDGFALSILSGDAM